MNLKESNIKYLKSLGFSVTVESRTAYSSTGKKGKDCTLLAINEKNKSFRIKAYSPKEWIDEIIKEIIK